MHIKLIKFTNGSQYLLSTLSRVSHSDPLPNDYNSYYQSSEVYASLLKYNVPHAIIGKIVNGAYTGFLGTLEDFNGNTYDISFSGGTVTYTITTPKHVSVTGTYNHDCTLQFFSTFPDSGGNFRVGIMVTYPWDSGSYASVAPGSADGCFSMEASYLDFIDMYSDKSIFHAQRVEGEGVFGCVTDTQDFDFFGFYVRSGNTSISSASLPFGDGDNDINIDESIDDFDPDEDPYNDPDEGTHPGGGDGDHDKNSDPIDYPSLPTLSAVDTGFITLYNPSVAQLHSLADYMWGNLFDLDTFKKLFADPMDTILGLAIVPVDVPAGSSQTVKVGNISTGVSMTKAGSQYVTVDCGSISVNEYWGSYLDYEPYTKMEIFLPFIGIRQVSSDELMNKTVGIKYNVDILSGACTAFIKCGNSVLYSFEGQCSCMVPVSNMDWSATITAAVNAATAIGAMVATGGASAALGAEAEGARAQMMAAKMTSQCISTGGSVVSSAMNAVKPQIQKSGGLHGCAGLMGGKKPYLIITRPKQAVPGSQNRYQGYPSFITATLSSLSGYTEIDSIIIENVPASDTELAEIVGLLQGGVIL